MQEQRDEMFTTRFSQSWNFPEARQDWMHLKNKMTVEKKIFSAEVNAHFSSDTR